MTTEELYSPPTSGKGPRTDRRWQFALVRQASSALVIAAFALLVYGLAWNYYTRAYLKGFADAIVPLAGSPEEKTEALAKWFRNRPQRITPPPAESGILSGRDPVNIVQNARLLKICGSATNAFVNLADVAGLRARRLLLLDESRSTKHVVAEVQWASRWVVINPQQGLVFRDHLGRALTKEELRDPEVFRDAISQMPGYSPTYTFERTIHIRLRRIPILGEHLRRLLDRFVPGWEEAISWDYFPENPSLWPIFVSLPLLLLGTLSYLIVNRYDGNRRGIATPGFRE